MLTKNIASSLKSELSDGLRMSRGWLRVRSVAVRAHVDHADVGHPRRPPAPWGGSGSFLCVAHLTFHLWLILSGSALLLGSMQPLL